MFLNPVIRFDGKTKPQNVFIATINSGDTILYRSFLIMCWIFLVIYFNRRSAAQLLSLLKKIPSVNKGPSLVRSRITKALNNSNIKVPNTSKRLQNYL